MTVLIYLPFLITVVLFAHEHSCVTHTAIDLETKLREIWAKGVRITGKVEYEGQEHYFYSNLKNVNFFLSRMDLDGIVSEGADELLFEALVASEELYNRIEERIDGDEEIQQEVLEIPGIADGDENGKVYGILEIHKIRFIVGKVVELISYVGYIPIRASHDGHITLYLPDCHISGSNKWTLVIWTEESVEEFRQHAVDYFGENPDILRNGGVGDVVCNVQQNNINPSDSNIKPSDFKDDGSSTKHIYSVHEFDLSILVKMQTKVLSIETVLFSEQLKLEVRRLFGKDDGCEIAIFDVKKQTKKNPFLMLRMWEDDNMLVLLSKSTSFSFFSWDCDDNDDDRDDESYDDLNEL